MASRSPLVVSTTYLTEEAVEVLEAVGARVVWPERGIDVSKWLLSIIPGADVVMAGFQRVTEEHIARAEKLRLLLAMSSGVDHLAVEAAARRGVCVANQPEAIAVAVAEHAIGLIISSLRRITEGHGYVASGRWHAERRFLRGTSLRGKTVGIVGLGRIGSLVALHARGLGAGRILYWSRRRKKELEQLLLAEPASLERLFTESDIVVVALPLTGETRGIIGRELLERLRPGALLVNIGRGGVVDANALVEVLRRREDIRVALDVYPEEPLPPSHPLAELARETGRLLLTPHHAGGTEESMKATRLLAAKQAAYFLEKGEVWNPVAGPCREARDIPGLWENLW